MLSARRMQIKPFGVTSVVKVRLMHKSGKTFHGFGCWYVCIGCRTPKFEVAAPEPANVPLRRYECGERAEMLFHILLSKGTFSWNVPYDWFTGAESPLSDGTNGFASPFNVVSAFYFVFFLFFEKKIKKIQWNNFKWFNWTFCFASKFFRNV